MEGRFRLREFQYQFLKFTGRTICACSCSIFCVIRLFYEHQWSEPTRHLCIVLRTAVAYAAIDAYHTVLSATAKRQRRRRSPLQQRTSVFAFLYLLSKCPTSNNKSQRFLPASKVHVSGDQRTWTSRARVIISAPVHGCTADSMPWCRSVSRTMASRVPSSRDVDGSVSSARSKSLTATTLCHVLHCWKRTKI